MPLRRSGGWRQDASGGFKRLAEQVDIIARDVPKSAPIIANLRWSNLPLRPSVETRLHRSGRRSFREEGCYAVAGNGSKLTYTAAEIGVMLLTILQLGFMVSRCRAVTAYSSTLEPLRAENSGTIC